jgi:hypothetical protein
VDFFSSVQLPYDGSYGISKSAIAAIPVVIHPSFGIYNSGTINVTDLKIGNVVDT